MLLQREVTGDTGFTPRDFTDTTEEVWPSQDDRGEEHQDLNMNEEDRT